MIPYIHITIPSYGLLAVIGLLAAMYWQYYQAILKGEDFLTFRQFLLLAGCSLAGCVIGSKLLFGITQLPEIAAEASWQAAAKAFVFGGFVFYGGLLGGLAGAAVFAKVKRRKVSEILNYVTPGFVLFHAFGRIGCLLAGCCYGFPLTSDWQILGLVFHYFPLQAVEAVFEFTMFGVLIRYIPEKRRCMIYLFAYGVYRFAAEFFRGDTARGIWLGISTSQWIRLLIIISLIIYWIRCKAITKRQQTIQPSIDGLAEIVQGQLHLDPFSKALFLFCGRRRDRIKGLLWEGDGFLLLYKRLDNGNFQWPRNETEARLLTPQQTRWLLEGLMIEQPKAIKDGKPGAMY